MRQTQKSTRKAVVAPLPIESLIHVIRGQKVMLDRDLAALYGVTTSALNQAVRRNMERFPEDFAFQLTPQEEALMRSHFVIASKGNIKYQAFVFSEHGVAMLSAVLLSKRAVQTSIYIVRTFMRMRELIASNKDIAARVEKLEPGHKRTASVIEVLVEDIDRLALDVKEIKKIPAPQKRRMGFIVD